MQGRRLVRAMGERERDASGRGRRGEDGAARDRASSRGRGLVCRRLSRSRISPAPSPQPPPAPPARGARWAGPARTRRGEGGRGGGEGGAAGGRVWLQLTLFFFPSFFTPFSFQTGKSAARAVASFSLAFARDPRTPLPSGGRAESPAAARARGAERGARGLPRRHMAAGTPRAPAGAAPSSPEARRLRPAAPEPGSG